MMLSEIVVCLIWCSLSSLILYTVSMVILQRSGKGKLLQETYWFLKVYVLLLPVLLLVTLLAGCYLFQTPGSFGLMVHTRKVTICLRVLCWIWLGGVFLNGGRLAAGEMKFRKLCREYADRDKALEEMAKEIAVIMGIRKAPVVMTGTVFEFPQVAGNRNPHIYLPDKEYTEVQIRGILAHELSHFQRRDMLYRWASAGMGVIFWFNPIITGLLDRLDYWDELYCDYQVCALGGIEPVSYTHLRAHET